MAEYTPIGGVRRPWNIDILAEPPLKEPTPGHMPWDFPVNLVRDLGQTVRGIPAGMVNLFTDPIETAEEAAKLTWHDWSPLFKGDPEEFFTNFMEHPLAPLLDIATVATGGAAIGGRVGLLAARTGSTGKLARLGKYSVHQERSFSTATGRAQRAGFIQYAQPKVVTKKGEDVVQFDPVSANLLRGKPLPTNNPLAKYRKQQMHNLSVYLTREFPNVFGPKAGNLAKLNPMSQVNRFEQQHLRKIAGNKVALHAWYATMMNAAKTLSDDPIQERKFRSRSWKENYGRAVSHASDHPLNKPLPQGYQWVDRSPDLNKDKRLFDVSLEEAFTNFGEVITTPSAKRAHTSRSKKGYGKIVPRKGLDIWGAEGKQATGLLKRLYFDPTTAWKVIMLGYAPRFFVNNAVGNMILYLSMQGGGGAMRGLVDAYRQVKDEKGLAQSMTDVEKMASYGYIDRHFGDQMAGIMQSHQLGMPGDIDMRSKWLQKLQKGPNFFGITHRVSDIFMRKAAINAKTRNIPEVAARRRELMDNGLTPREALDRAADEYFAANPRQRDRISAETADILGDYVTLNPVERHLRNIIPFYAWDRHILRTTKNMVLDRPGRTMVGVLIGEVGHGEQEEIFGTMLPEFLQNTLPLEMLGIGEGEGRIPAISTHGLNPFATSPELIESMMSLVSSRKRVGQTLGSQINPFLQGIIEGFGGSSLLSGAPKEPLPGGLLGNIFGRTMLNLPQVRLGAALGGPAPQAKGHTDFLYDKSRVEAIGAYLGIPYKEILQQRAMQLAKAEVETGAY